MNHNLTPQKRIHRSDIRSKSKCQILIFIVDIDKRLLHWSNIVGASHSRNYEIWQYGGYATKGVKEVCEFGYPRTLEQEMRRHVSNRENI